MLLGCFFYKKAGSRFGYCRGFDLKQINFEALKRKELPYVFKGKLPPMEVDESCVLVNPSDTKDPLSMEESSPALTFDIGRPGWGWDPLPGLQCLLCAFLGSEIHCRQLVQCLLVKLEEANDTVV